MATLGGNLAHASPAAETATPMLVHDAVVHLAGVGGPRGLPLGGLWVGPGRTSLARGEVMTGLEVPRPALGWTSAYRRLELRRSVDIALVSASVALGVDESGVTVARVALGAVAPVPLLVPEAGEALVGVELCLDEEGQPGGELATAAKAAGELCRLAARPITDGRGGDEYRRAMVPVVVERALAAAARRAEHRRRDGGATIRRARVPGPRQGIRLASRPGSGL